MTSIGSPTLLHRPETPVQSPGPQLGPALIEVDTLIRVSEARTRFKVSGEGQCVAVLDTGCRTTHVDFAGRVPTQVNFTSDNGGDPNDASDGDGHGTNVSGIIVAGDLHVGVAPRAHLIPIKVLGNNGSGSFAAVRDALQWVLDHHAQHRIGAVCMSLGDGGNYRRDQDFPNDEIGRRIRELRQQRVAVCVAAGNAFFTHGSAQGMGYPAIFRSTVSVGAVYDEDEGSFSYSSGAVAFSTAPDRLTPFSQRLHPSVQPETYTDIFAPGAPVTSTGILNDRAESTQHGTSQACPVTAGVVLLLREFYERATGTAPEVDDIVSWMRAGAVVVHDGDDESDNVINTELDYRRVDAVGALRAAMRQLERQILVSGPATTERKLSYA